ncbi:hypothetical protein EVAR_22136_1 [Eumeta japonica]|uniref:Uncharacterized protein n=1 Tax=Eumeta variegata TaxID=151549 RepID=A0A4C1W121_EUMVA|nr:hypothetical protein EVAR_22136_1 [Eumeta japonica]
MHNVHPHFGSALRNAVKASPNVDVLLTGVPTARDMPHRRFLRARHMMSLNTNTGWVRLSYPARTRLGGVGVNVYPLGTGTSTQFINAGEDGGELIFYALYDNITWYRP